ncbi:MAG: SpoIIE family protein phosphatase [Marinobacter sp.]
MISKEVIGLINFSEWMALLGFAFALSMSAALYSYRRKVMHVMLQHEENRNQLSRELRSAVADTRALLNQTSQIIMVFERHAPILLFANQQALNVFEKQTIAQLMNDIISRPDAWLDAPHRLIDFEDWLGKAKNLGMENKEWCFKTGQDDHLWVEATISNTVFEGRPARLFAANNIHGSKTNQIAEHLRGRALLGIMSGRSLENVLDTLSKLAEIVIPGSNCVLTLYDEQSATLRPSGSSPFERNFRKLFPTIMSCYGATSIGTAAYISGRVICENLQTDHRWQGYGSLVAELGMTSSWSEAIPGKDGNLLGVITVFFERMKSPTDQEITDFSSVVSLVSLAIERHTWQVSLETALSGERFIRDVGVRLAGITFDNLREELESVLLHIKGQYKLGGITLWERPIKEKYFTPIASTSADIDPESPGLILSVDEVKSRLSDASSDYVMPSDGLYKACSYGHENRPILVMPLIVDQQTTLGLLTVQSRYFYIPKSVIDYLLIIGSMISTSMMNSRLVSSLSQSVKREKGAREKLEGELSVARDIQMSMVPLQGEFREDYKDWTIEAMLKPARAVGGDFYDVIRCDDGKLLLVVGDVSDKGVPAALFMAKSVSLINYLSKEEASLNAMVAKLNSELSYNNDSCMFVTAVFALLDLSNGEVEFVNAGHTAPLLVGPFASPEFISGESGPPLGLYEGVQYQTDQVKIEQGASLTLYSDGVTESFNESREEFGDARLIRVGYRANDKDASFLTTLRREVEQFSGYAPQSDDITIMTIQRQARKI